MTLVTCVHRTALELPPPDDAQYLRFVKTLEFGSPQRVVVTEKLVKFGLDSIDGRLSFFEDGRYAHGAEKFTCGIAISITQCGRTGLGMSHVECWPHDSSRESRRAVPRGGSGVFI
ncbi:MAG TPA: hypothetical protein VK178_11155 [Opitutaceae bacterium]|nr:hypothetical protein [Opitutaceae bacterium]